MRVNESAFSREEIVTAYSGRRPYCWAHGQNNCIVQHNSSNLSLRNSWKTVYKKEVGRAFFYTTFSKCIKSRVVFVLTPIPIKTKHLGHFPRSKHRHNLRDSERHKKMADARFLPQGRGVHSGIESSGCACQGPSQLTTVTLTQGAFCQVGLYIMYPALSPFQWTQKKLPLRKV